jgi:quercetin dioxygenase-like cupin family protein
MNPIKVAPMVLLILCACTTAGTQGPSAEALPHGAVIKKLDAGTVASLPTGSVYIRFIRFIQPPGYIINSKQHVPSIVFVEVGTHRLVLAGQTPVDLAAGEAIFHQSVTHQHLNPGSVASTWFSIAVWPNTARGTPLVDPIAKAAFESADINRANLAQGPYSESLRSVRLDARGTAGAHRFGGLSAFYVLSGSITVRSPHQARVLNGGEGVAFLSNTDLQETNSGAGDAVYLEFVVTPAGSEYDVPLQQPPPS